MIAVYRLALFALIDLMLAGDAQVLSALSFP